MATPTTRQDLKDYCLRSLGFPVIDINVDEDQVDDRIDEALQKFAEFHYDGTHNDYMAIQITAEMIANASNTSANTSNTGGSLYGWIPLPDNVVGVSRILPLSSSFLSSTGSGGNYDFNIFDLQYQLRLNELYEFTSSSYQYYWIARTHIRMLEMLLIGINPIRFNKKMNRLYIDMNWSRSEVSEGKFIIVECARVLTAEEFPRVYNDSWLKRYATQLIKRQWGENMKKYANYTLPGGMVINGQQIYDEAKADIALLEQELRDTWEEPPMFLLG